VQISRIAAFVCALAAALAAPSAEALSVSFGDSVRYWSGHASGTSDDAKDTIGHPDLQGGEAFFMGSQLTAVRIDYTGPFSLATSGNGSVIPGDLFLDAGADGDWDYVVKAVTGPQAAGTYASLQILDVTGQANAYLLSGTDNAGHWSGYHVRNQHPYAWAGGGSVVGTASLAIGNLLAGGSQSLLFELGEGIDLGGSFALAFAPSCANDVIFERVSAPVPEPGAALLFGAGLAFVVGAQRRRA
jgi:hypothetical protein